ncbi:PEP-CTERM sorting domain-containing protein [candidate division KSB1 bacterium]|nr:PEP-CTERM sorting domain-containing protein [candidate division KSB1 bacterium]
MNKQKLLLLISVAGFLFVFGSGIASAYTIDGFVSDDWGIDLTSAVSKYYLNTNTPTGPTVDTITEDNADQLSGVNTYVGPGYTHNGNTYDVEAIYFDNDVLYGYIAIVSGVAPLAVHNSGTYQSGYMSGDIGISVTSGTGEHDYEYGIDINNNYAGGSDPTAQLMSVSDWDEVEYYPEANPWEINAGSAAGTGYAQAFYTGYTPAYDSTYNGHYVLEVAFLLEDLGLLYGDEFTIHWTMECGNDYLDLVATVDPIPEPATMVLFGTGLIGIAGIGRKRIIKK